MIFSDSPSQKALERMMTQVKGFPPRGSGVIVLRRFEYTAGMCDCRLCLYYNRKKKCTVSQCPCIEERIVAGAAGRSEVMAETMKDIHNAAFRKRLIQFIRESEELPMNFRNEKHRLAFDEAIRKLNKKNFALMSALYLLTAEHKLWMQIRNFVERNEIKFDRFKPKDSTENGYTLLCCAKDLYLSSAAEHGNPYAEQLLHSIRSNRHWSAALGAIRLLHHLSRMIQNQLDGEKREKAGAIDRKLKRKIDEKKQAHGLKQG